MKLKSIRWIVTVAAALLTAPLFAHHGDAGRYEDTTTTITGTVVEFLFINPHSAVVLDVTDESGNVERWTGEMGSPSALGRNWNWTKETLKPGDNITMTGRARKNGEPFMTLSEGARLLDADGKLLYSGD
jgi:hypothetical protein